MRQTFISFMIRVTKMPVFNLQRLKKCFHDTYALCDGATEKINTHRKFKWLVIQIRYAFECDSFCNTIYYSDSCCTLHRENRKYSCCYR